MHKQMLKPVKVWTGIDYELLADKNFNQVIDVNITNKMYQHHASHDMIHLEKHITSVISFPIYNLNLIRRKYQTNPYWENF